MTASFTGIFGLHESTQTIEAMKEGMNQSIEVLSEVGGKVQEAVVKAGYGRPRGHGREEKAGPAGWWSGLPATSSYYSGNGTYTQACPWQGELSSVLHNAIIMQYVMFIHTLPIRHFFSQIYLRRSQGEESVTKKAA